MERVNGQDCSLITPPAPVMMSLFHRYPNPSHNANPIIITGASGAGEVTDYTILAGVA